VCHEFTGSAINSQKPYSEKELKKKLKNSRSLSEKSQIDMAAKCKTYNEIYG